MLRFVSLVLCVAVVAAQQQNSSNAGTFRNQPLSATGNFLFQWIAKKNPQDPFRIRITGQSKGWLGVGFSPNGAMRNSDIVLCWFDSNGNPQISERHGPTDEANGYPPADPQQNYQLVNAQRNDSFMTFELVRPMDTCDPNDYQVSSGTVQVIYAANDIPPISADNFQKHTVRGGQAVRLLDPPAAPPTDFTTYVDITSGGVHVPQDQDTLYFCRAYKAQKFPEMMQMIGHQMLVQPGNEKYVHHILFYGCTGNNTQALLNIQGDCFAEALNITTQCSSTIGGWAVGGQPYTYPSNMGKQYFGELYDVIGAQWHYDNSDHDAGIVDNSTMRVFLTDQLRPMKVGSLGVGAVTMDTNIVVPPNQATFQTQFLCPTNCTKNIPGPINIISGLLHAHLAGISIRVRQIRNGQELPNPIADDNYDFNYQTPVIRFDNPAQMLPGDYLILECTYDTQGRPNATLGGIGTHEEMCLAFMEYYPAGDTSVFGCQSLLLPNSVVNFLGGTNYSEMNMNPEFDYSTLLYNGQNMTYNNWINSLPWSANNNSLANNFENFVLSAPQYVMCAIPSTNPDGTTTNSTNFMSSPPQFTPYVAVDAYCASRG